MHEMYDVIVLGAGAGGIPAAIRAAQLGGRVCVIEAQDLGGLCMNRGCVPFGNMMAAANILGNISLAKDLGLNAPKIKWEFGALVNHQRDLISFMREGVKGLLAKHRIEVINGKGRVVGKGKVEVGNRTISCNNIILATGGKWSKLEFAGSHLDDIVNADYFVNTKALPKRVILYGSSPWIVELAQFLRRFGSEVILATPDKELLPNESKTIVTRLKKTLSTQGIATKTSAKIIEAKKEKEGLHVVLEQGDGMETIVVDKMAILDRIASMRDLGLRSINLDEDSEYLKVSEEMETAASAVYAIGDLSGPLFRHYSSVASQGGLVAAENVMGVHATFNPKTVSRVLFTQPQIGSVGLTKSEAKKMGHDVLVGSAPYSMNTLGMILSEAEGIVELVADKKYGELLGAHFLGRAATEMVGHAIMAIDMEITIEQLSKIPFPHPTLSESFSEAARDAIGMPIYLP